MTDTTETKAENKEKHREHPEDLKESVSDAIERLYFDFKLDM